MPMLALAAMTELALAYSRASKWEEAAVLYIEILNANKAKLGPADPATIDAVASLGNIYRGMGQLEKAVPLWEDALKDPDRETWSGQPRDVARDVAARGSVQERGSAPGGDCAARRGGRQEPAPEC